MRGLGKVFIAASALCVGKVEAGPKPSWYNVLNQAFDADKKFRVTTQLSFKMMPNTNPQEPNGCNDSTWKFVPAPMWPGGVLTLDGNGQPTSASTVTPAAGKSIYSTVHPAAYMVDIALGKQSAAKTSAELVDLFDGHFCDLITQAATVANGGTATSNYTPLTNAEITALMAYHDRTGSKDKVMFVTLIAAALEILTGEYSPFTNSSLQMYNKAASLNVVYKTMPTTSEPINEFWATVESDAKCATSVDRAANEAHCATVMYTKLFEFVELTGILLGAAYVNLEMLPWWVRNHAVTDSTAPAKLQLAHEFTWVPLSLTKVGVMGGVESGGAYTASTTRAGCLADLPSCAMSASEGSFTHFNPTGDYYAFTNQDNKSCFCNALHPQTGGVAQHEEFSHIFHPANCVGKVVEGSWKADGSGYTATSVAGRASATSANCHGHKALSSPVTCAERTTALVTRCSATDARPWLRWAQLLAFVPGEVAVWYIKYDPLGRGSNVEGTSMLYTIDLKTPGNTLIRSLPFAWTMTASALGATVAVQTTSSGTGDPKCNTETEICAGCNNCQEENCRPTTFPATFADRKSTQCSMMAAQWELRCKNCNVTAKPNTTVTSEAEDPASNSSAAPRVSVTVGALLGLVVALLF